MKDQNAARSPDEPVVVQVLIVRAALRLCALSVQHVEETLRPPEVLPLPTDLPFVSGVSIIRGREVPLVDLARLLGTGEGDAGRRVVTIRVPPERRVGLIVAEVLGVRRLDERALGDLPPLLDDDAAPASVTALGRLDGALLSVLDVARVVPERIFDDLGSDHR